MRQLLFMFPGRRHPNFYLGRSPSDESPIIGEQVGPHGGPSTYYGSHDRASPIPPIIAGTTILLLLYNMDAFNYHV